MPPLSVIFPVNKNIEQKFAVLRYGSGYNATVGYNTLFQAQEDGAVVMAYGYVLTKVRPRLHALLCGRWSRKWGVCM